MADNLVGNTLQNQSLPDDDESEAKQSKDEQMAQKSIRGLQPERVIEESDTPAPLQARKRKRRTGVHPEQIKVRKDIAKAEKPSFIEYLFLLIYKNLYILGATLIRQRRSWGRKIRRILSKGIGGIYAGIRNIGFRIRRSVSWFWRRVKVPVTRIQRTYHEELPTIRKVRYEGKLPLQSYKEVAKQVGLLFIHVLATVFNYGAPIVAGLLLLNTVSTYLYRPMGLEITYQGEILGYVEQEKDFSKALDDVKNRIITLDGRAEEESLLELPKYQLVEMEDWQEYTDTETIANGIIRNSGSEIEQGYGVYIGGNLIGVVPEKEQIIDEFDSILENSLTGNPNEKRPEFLKNVSIKEGLYPVESVKPTEEVIDFIHSDESVDEQYLVVAGDTPSGVADKLGITYTELISLNPQLESSNFQPGTEVYTARAVPFLAVKNIFTDVYLEEVSFETEEVENKLYPKSFRNTEIEGSNGLDQVSAEVVYVNGVEMERNILSRQHVIPPTTEVVTIGVEQAPARAATGTSSQTQQTQRPTGSSSAAGSGQFIWPLAGGYISMPIWGYYMHTGTDIAGVGIGAAVYASASGTVTRSVRGYYNYGHYVKINHGNGYETLYAHMNDIYVNVGDYVTQGQIIGTSGRTGRVTGPHLHFEIINQGTYEDARKHIGYGS